MAKAKQIRITQVRSTIGAVPKHVLTMEALGFRRCYQTLVKADTPQIRGMLQQVRHLVRVEEVR
jgi:large subunit ribosomal protein L30